MITLDKERLEMLLSIMKEAKIEVINFRIDEDSDPKLLAEKLYGTSKYEEPTQQVNGSWIANSKRIVEWNLFPDGKVSKETFVLSDNIKAQETNSYNEPTSTNVYDFGIHSFLNDKEAIMMDGTLRPMMAKIFYDGRPNDPVSVKTWKDMESVLHLNDMVVLATKVPRTIANKFERFANGSGYMVKDEHGFITNKQLGRSAVLRELVIDYVKKNWLEQVDTLIYEN